MFRGYIYIILSAASFALIPIFAIYAYDSGVSTTTLLFLRFAFASIIFFAYIFLKMKDWKITKRQIVFLILLGGILYTIQSTLYFSSVKYIPASLAAILLYLYPIFVAILSFVVNKETPSRNIIISITLSLIGIILVLGSPKGHISLIGILFAGGSAVVYSVYILIGDRVTKQLSPMITCGFISLFSALSLFIGGTVTHTISFHFGRMGWIMAICVAVFCSVVAMFTFFAGMNIIGPTKASILSMIEPVVTFLLSTILFHDKMSAIQLLGGVIVLLGAVLVVLARENHKQAVNVAHSRVG